MFYLVELDLIPSQLNGEWKEIKAEWHELKAVEQIAVIRQTSYTAFEAHESFTQT